jgi:hypothetical protein
MVYKLNLTINTVSFTYTPFVHNESTVELQLALEYSYPETADVQNADLHAGGFLREIRG